MRLLTHTVKVPTRDFCFEILPCPLVVNGRNTHLGKDGFRFVAGEGQHRLGVPRSNCPLPSELFAVLVERAGERLTELGMEVDVMVLRPASRPLITLDFSVIDDTQLSHRVPMTMNGVGKVDDKTSPTVFRVGIPMKPGTGCRG